MSSPTRLILIRHAEVEARYQGVFVGREEAALSPRGHTQAEGLAAYLRPRPVEAVYASPMRRVQETLAPWRPHLARPPVILPDLREVDMGEWSGLSAEEVQARYGWSASRWLEALERGAIPGAETGQAFRDRVAPCLSQVCRDHAGQTVAVVCHGGVIRVLLSLLLHLELPQTAVFHIDYASITRVHLLADRTRVQVLGFAPWRDLP